MRISIIVPVVDEAGGLAAALGGLQPARERGHEVIVVDGGSKDATVAIAQPLADRVIASPRGRAAQMNAGANEARSDALLFLHADPRLPEEADALVTGALGQHVWGRFDVSIDSSHPALAVVGFMMNLRSRWTGIATGDQAMFVRRTTFAEVGGFPALALMEDIALSSRLRKIGPPACLSERVLTSGRRWERGGIIATVMLMWRLRFLYFLGADPQRLARDYEGGR